MEELKTDIFNELTSEQLDTILNQAQINQNNERDTKEQIRRMIAIFTTGD